MKIQVIIKKHTDVLDTEGKTIMNSLHLHKFSKVQNAIKGSVIELEIDTNDKDEALKYAKEICEEFLVNHVIEQYECFVA